MMMNDLPMLVKIVAAAYSSGSEHWVEDDCTISRIRGGMNNILYRIEAGEEHFACKLCLVDERRRAAREFSALKLLEASQIDVAPLPLALDLSTSILPFPAVFYRWLDGKPLQLDPTTEQLDSLMEGFQKIHALRREDHASYNLPEAWFHWFEYEPYLAELEGFLALYGTWLKRRDPEGAGLFQRLEKLTVDSRDLLKQKNLPDPKLASVSQRLCRVDPNLANCIVGSDGKVRWVDWESSGWGDPALELAEIRWHISWARLSDEQHKRFRYDYSPPGDDVDFSRRLNVWDRVVSARWPFLILRRLWSWENSSQSERLRQPDFNPAEFRRRFMLSLGRAEKFSFPE
jgi:aminoglycoside phosphotransferase (APT) family kinase protein